MSASAARTRAVLALAVVAAAAALPGCVVLVGGAMVGGAAMVALDRRTSGAQLEDQSIELKAGARVRDLATLGRVDVTSYNRMVLLSGEVPAEDERARVEAAVARVENVRAVVNELVVAPNATLGQRSSDTLLSGRVKTALASATEVPASAVKVVTERGTVYLMGLVGEAEATRAADLVSTVPGVQKVVRVFEILSDEELAAIKGSAPKPAPAQ